MRRIIRRREIVADTVRYPAEVGAEGTVEGTVEGSAEGFVAGTRSLQPLADFLAAAKRSPEDSSVAAAAVLLGPTDEVEPLLPHLPRIDLIVIDFPKAGDGRGFSQARVLRQRCHYRGELRAHGALKRDQLFFLARCGFDSFDLDPSEDLVAALAAFDSFSVAYQGGCDELVTVRRREALTRAPPAPQRGK